MRRAPSVQDYERMTEPVRAQAVQLAQIQASLTAAELAAATEKQRVAKEERRLAREERRLIESRRRAITAAREREERVAGLIPALAEMVRVHAQQQNRDTPEVTAQRQYDLDIATAPSRKQDAA